MEKNRDKSPANRKPSHPWLARLSVAAVVAGSGYYMINKVVHSDAYRAYRMISSTRDRLNAGRQRDIEDRNNRVAIELQYYQEKMTPLLSVIPPEVLKLLQQYDVMASLNLGKIYVVMDDRALKQGNAGEYKGRFDFGPSGMPVFSVQGQYTLVLLRSPESFPTHFQLAKTLVHEIYGHGFDRAEVLINPDPDQQPESEYDEENSSLDDRNSTDSDEYENEEPVINRAKKVNSLCHIVPRWMESEIKSYYAACQFYEWTKKNAPDSLKPGDGDDDIYRLYREAQKNRDWSEFKRAIIQRYFLFHMNILVQLGVVMCNEENDDDDGKISALTEELSKAAKEKNEEAFKNSFDPFIDLVFKDKITPEEPQL